MSWLEGMDRGPDGRALPTDAVNYEDFMADVGALLMGRRTHDVVQGFDVPWPYGPRPVLVATRRPLEPAADTVRAVRGSIDELVDQALEAAGGKDVYVDGGDIIRQVMDAGRVDELIVTIAPLVLGSGRPLFAGATRRHSLEIVEHTSMGAMVQLRMLPGETTDAR